VNDNKILSVEDKVALKEGWICDNCKPDKYCVECCASIKRVARSMKIAMLVGWPLLDKSKEWAPSKECRSIWALSKLKDWLANEARQ